METKVLEQEEIQSIKDLQVKREQLMADFGFIEMRIQELELQKENLINALVEVRNSEATLSNELQTKYGNGTIDLEKGEITIAD
jgi:stress response protein YsnF